VGQKMPRSPRLALIEPHRQLGTELREEGIVSSDKFRSRSRRRPVRAMGWFILDLAEAREDCRGRLARVREVGTVTGLCRQVLKFG
jgi:hypothetical protein